MISINKKFWFSAFLVALLVLINVSLLAPEALRERMAPYDSSGLISTGAFFLSVFEDLGNFITAPFNWVIEYYKHYPGFSIRRYGPLFGLVEGVMYAIFGISAVTAKFTILLFSVLWILGWFLTIRKLFKDDFIAFFSVLLMLSLPVSVTWGRSVRLDIPSMMFFSWACYFYACYLDHPEKGYRYAILTSVLLACCYYTYPLPSFAIGILFLYMLISDRKRVFKKPWYHIITFSLFAVLISPLLLYFVKTGQYTSSLVTMKEDLLPFIPVKSRLTLEYWIYYLRVMWKESCVLLIGMILWVLTKLRFSLHKHELLFLLWFILGYIALSFLPSKGSRHHLHFVIAAAPLTAIGVRDIVRILLEKWMSRKYLPVYISAILTFLFFWNISGISGAMKHEYVQGVDKAAYRIVSQKRWENILYYGRFEKVFPFYIRKYDTDRKIRVLRLRPYKMSDRVADVIKGYSPVLSNKVKSLRQACSPEKIMDTIRKNEISIIVIESENLRKGMREGIYDLFYIEMKSIVEQEELCKHIKDFPVLFGPPGEEKQVLLKVFRWISM